jgi:hypothetical protein
METDKKNTNSIGMMGIILLVIAGLIVLVVVYTELARANVAPVINVDTFKSGLICQPGKIPYHHLKFPDTKSFWTCETRDYICSDWYCAPNFVPAI